MKTQDLLPVILSIMIIILVAVLEKQSRFFAAITATMPLAAPLALWIVYSSSGGEKGVVTSFSLDMVLGFLPTLAFAVTLWLAARSGMKLIPMLATSYGVWALGAFILYLLKNFLGLR